MGDLYVSWAVAAAVMVVGTAIVGRMTTAGTWWGVIVDRRGRCSLSQLQLTLWTIVVLSLIAGVFFGRLVAGIDDPLDFDIPAQVLALIGVSLGSAAVSTAVKASKDGTQAKRIAAVLPLPLDGGPTAGTGTRLSQIFLYEEGTGADEYTDITKYQNFWITLVLVVAYVALALDAIHDAGTPSAMTGLPAPGREFVVLLGISHAGYIAGKLPSQPGQVQEVGLRTTVATRDAYLRGRISAR